MAIVFVHSNLAQFRLLHGWLCSTGRVESFLLCSEVNYRKWSGRVPNLVPFRPHGGKLKSDGSFYYLTRVEGAMRRSLGIRQALQELRKTTRIDLFVGHVTAGCPAMLFDDPEFDFPIVTYLEFPSFRAHGWDPKYPPPETKQLRDRSFEMLCWHSVLRSDHAIVPSAYARSLFPQELQPKISVLMEGFEWDREWLDTPCQETVAGSSGPFAAGVAERRKPSGDRAPFPAPGRAARAACAAPLPLVPLGSRRSTTAGECLQEGLEGSLEELAGNAGTKLRHGVSWHTVRIGGWSVLRRGTCPLRRGLSSL